MTIRGMSWEEAGKFQLLTINPRNVDTDNDNQDISVDGHAVERKGEIKSYK